MNIYIRRVKGEDGEPNYLVENIETRDVLCLPSIQRLQEHIEDLDKIEDITS